MEMLRAKKTKLIACNNDIAYNHTYAYSTTHAQKLMHTDKTRKMPCTRHHAPSIKGRTETQRFDQSTVMSRSLEITCHPIQFAQIMLSYCNGLQYPPRNKQKSKAWLWVYVSPTARAILSSSLRTNASWSGLCKAEDCCCANTCYTQVTRFANDLKAYKLV